MYYELYIDILFLINFMMDFLLLLMVKRITRYGTTYMRLVAGSFIGSISTCVIVIYFSHFRILEFIAFHVIVNTIIIKVGFKIYNVKMLFRCLISLYIGSFLLGGVFQVFSQYMKIGSLFFCMAICSYSVVRCVWKCIEYFRESNTKWREVEIWVEKNQLEVTALMDTGNGLVDPYINKPVCVLDKSCADKLLENVDESKLVVRYIPYQTIGNRGVLRAFRADKLQLCGDAKKCIEYPIIAISEESVSKQGAYQMILNPDIF